MKCKKDKAQKMKSIQARLEAELEEYTESQNKVFKELDMYDVFTVGVGVDFKDNLNRIKMIVENAENNSDMHFDDLEEFIVKLKKRFNTLPRNKKDTLMSEDFLITMKSLFTDSNCSLGSRQVADVVTGVASAAIDAASTAPWWEAIHGLNVLINAGFFMADIKKDPKFQDEVNLRDMIFQIRDNIMKNGY